MSAIVTVPLPRAQGNCVTARRFGEAITRLAHWQTVSAEAVTAAQEDGAFAHANIRALDSLEDKAIS